MKTIVASSLSDIVTWLASQARLLLQGRGPMLGLVQDSRLETLLYRLEAQHACLAWAVTQIAGRPGPILELGLGHGRTFDYLRKNLPGRDIYVFDREIDCFPDCVPEPRFMIVGELEKTLAEARDRFSGSAILAHCDVGSYGDDHNRRISDIMADHLPALLAPGGLALSDLPLQLRDAEALPLPPGARAGRYHIYRHHH